MSIDQSKQFIPLNIGVPDGNHPAMKRVMESFS
jgi:hypothetical protein